ncbi:Type II restriction-modification system methylation subunit [Streptococcus pneumoniae]|uniref:HpaII family restriction endonuclease n=1 Tax=Bacillus paranthracis TaxID=2026186 RepID=UPI0005DDA9B6|nr:HpaII family restriction endonuclease [Bacillus paranthracis]CKE55264.1 Type II restriction-modification system methylation subunit [Streptococcus pneumoniae]CKE89469.1 Type II restriction-modification system methylation subunit [Streptococcus pneumoniae]CKF02992.1 Type II restriction-modification system methylation subunit [Bacillus paranthracis]CKF10930.1 Type II restriction-modification system methylation subunit [Streptococcus pneumoniae]CKF18065.1 Type II restriction-modification syste
MRYSEIAESLNLYITKHHKDDTLSYITHYLQTYGHPAADYYADVALKYIPENIDLNNITWDIPFPNVENPKFTFIDLFAGIGGTRIAFENLGGKCVFSSEIDPFAKQSYQFNYGEVPFGDITQINEQSIPDHDVLVGGFPCQAFSIAGKRGGFDDTRGTLFFEIARILREKRPKAFFLENVKGLLSHDRGRTINVILNTLREDLGYFVPDPEIVNAADFGVPQKRDRVYIVGFRRDLNINEFKYPTPLNYKTSFIDVREENVVSSKYYLSESLLETLRNHRFRHASAGNGFGYEVIDDEGIANAIVTGGMGRERNLIVDKRLKDFTPVTHIKGEINKEGIRRMTPREWARLQGFPDKFEIKVSDTQAYKQFGNSVAVPAIQATGKGVIQRLIENGALEGIEHENMGNTEQQTSSDNSGEIGLVTLNKGEWSEVYTVLKLLADGKLYAADSDLNKMESIYYPLIKILRSELLNKKLTNYEYLYEETIDCPEDVKIRVVHGDTSDTLLELSVEEFKNKSLQLLKDIQEGQGRSFPVSPDVERFLQSIYISKMSESSDKKRDITIVVHDLVTGFEPELGFSIKSKLGSAATLLNASGATNFTFKFTGQAPLSDEEIARINNTYSSTYERIMELEKMGYQLEFDKLENNIFKSNLQMIDSSFPFVISELLKYYYKRECSSSMEDMMQHIEHINPCGFDTTNTHPFYRYKMKNFLVDVALGMKPNEIWHGIYDANGGYIVVKKDGELVCYHVYNRNEFQDYLLKNTRLEAASRSKHDFGYVLKDGNDLLMKLNLQIRFK